MITAIVKKNICNLCNLHDTCPNFIDSPLIFVNFSFKSSRLSIQKPDCNNRNVEHHFVTKPDRVFRFLLIRLGGIFVQLLNIVFSPGFRFDRLVNCGP